MPTTRKLLITVSCGILVAIAGAGVVIQKGESIKIRWYTWKMGSEDTAVRMKAFEWLYKKAEINIEDTRLEAFFKHPESRKQAVAEGKNNLLGVSVVRKFSSGWYVEWEAKNPLFSAVENGDLVNLKILLDQGAEVNAKTKRGRTLLHWTASRNSAMVTKTLIENGADAKAKDNRGRTPMHIAADHGNDKVAQVLIEHGAKVNAKDNDDRTPLDLACNHSYIFYNKPAIITLLRAHGAKTGAELEAKAKAMLQKTHK